MGEAFIELLIAVVSGMGLGGGGLLVIYLTLGLGAEQLVAQGANLVFFVCVAAVSTVCSACRGRIVWARVMPISIVGGVFALLGAFLAGAVPAAALRRIFGAVLVVGGGISLISKK